MGSTYQRLGAHDVLKTELGLGKAITFPVQDKYSIDVEHSQVASRLMGN